MTDYANALLMGDMGEQAKPKITPEKPAVKPTATEKPMNYADSLLLGDLGPKDPWIGSKPLNSVMTELKKQPDSAGFMTNLIAGIADDPQAQVRVYAKARFPDMPEPERLKRYGVHGGEIVYMGDDGNLYPETAKTFWQKTKRFAAKTGSNAPAIVLSIIGSLAGPGTAALGAAGGEGIRKSIAGVALDEPQTTAGNVISMAKEGALAGAGDVAGRGAASFINKLGAKRGGMLAAEAGRGRQLIDIDNVKTLEALGKKFDIDLYPPQTTGSKRLADKFNLLGDLESSAPIIQKARQKQVEQINESVYKFFESISGDKSTVSATGGKLVDASKKALQVPVKVRQAKASPLYKKAFESDSVVDVEPVAKWIDAELSTAKGDVRNALLKSKKLLMSPDLPKKLFDSSGNIIGEGFDTTVKGLHGTKISLDAAKQKSVQGNVKYIYDKVKKQLLEQIDKASPDYAKARKIFSEFSEEVNKQGKKTILGDISKLEGDKVVGATKKLFASAEAKKAPEIVTRIKAAITKQNSEVWNKAIVDHLQDIFESTKQSATGGITNIGGHFYKKVWGDLSQRKVLKAAMDAGQYKNLENFMKVMKTAGIILGKESQTANRQVMIDEITGKTLKKAFRVVALPLVTWKRAVGETLLESTLYRNSAKLAEAMTSEKAARQLEKMVQLGPRSEQALPMLTNFMSQVIAGEYGRESKRSKAKDVLPLALQPPLKNRAASLKGR